MDLAIPRAVTAEVFDKDANLVRVKYDFENFVRDILISNPVFMAGAEGAKLAGAIRSVYKRINKRATVKVSPDELKALNVGAQGCRLRPEFNSVAGPFYEAIAAAFTKLQALETKGKKTKK